MQGGDDGAARLGYHLQRAQHLQYAKCTTCVFGAIGIMAMLACLGARALKAQASKHACTALLCFPPKRLRPTGLSGSSGTQTGWSGWGWPGLAWHGLVWAHLLCVVGVKARGGLVQQQDPGVCDELHADGHPAGGSSGGRFYHTVFSFWTTVQGCWGRSVSSSRSVHPGLGARQGSIARPAGHPPLALASAHLSCRPPLHAPLALALALPCAHAAQIELLQHSIDLGSYLRCCGAVPQAQGSRVPADMVAVGGYWSKWFSCAMIGGWGCSNSSQLSLASLAG